MPLNNPAALYTGGKAALNPMPYVNIALQARAKKQAREDALNQYYEKLPDTINDKGVRDQEIPVINQMRDDLYKYGVENRKALINPRLDNGAARYNLEKMMRNINGVVQESKNAAQDDLQLGKLWFDKNNQWALNNEDFIANHAAHNLPVNDPNYKRMNLAQVMSQRPFDEATFVKGLKGRFPYQEKVNRTPDKENPGFDIVTTTPVLNDESKQNIYNYAVDNLHNDPSFRRKIQKDLAGTGQLEELNKISIATFGHPINSDEDIAAAYTVSKLSPPATKEKSSANWDYRFGARNKEWDRRNRISFGQSMQKIAANKQAGIDDSLGYISDEVASEVAENWQLDRNVAKMIGADPNENYRVVYSDKVDPKRLNIIIGANDKGIGGVKPIDIPQTDGSVRKGYLINQGTGDWVGAGGQEISRERAKDDYIRLAAPNKFRAKLGTKASENTFKDKKSGTNNVGILNDL